MVKKTALFKTKGMNRDMAVSAFSPEFCFENRNLRLSTNDDNTMMSWVNEKGTKLVTLYNENSNEELSIKGICIGTATLNHNLVLFVTNNKEDTFPDYIYRLKYRGNGIMEGKVLYNGDLHFNADYPIETLVSYEAEHIQKVYWTDGYNQPRMINIAHDYDSMEEGETYNPFDFVPELALKEKVTVKKMLGANGSFNPGVIQYALTYYNKNGQESNIFYTTPLCYISYKDRGAKADDTKVENAFKITVTGLDKHFDYLRIYSIQRTSINTTPVAKRVQDISIKDLKDSNGNPTDTVSYTDTGTNGDTVDPTELLYKGGEEMTAKTLEQKDSTLFLGNLKITRQMFVDDLASFIKDNTTITPSSRNIYPTEVSTDNYVYSNQLTSYADSSMQESVPCGGFKTGDTYRFGVQFQYKNGKWSNPVYLKDYSQTAIRPSANGNTVTLPTFTGTIDKKAGDLLLKNNYRKARAVVVFPNVQDRRTLCQGVACTTLYTETHEQKDKDLDAQSSWFFRPVIDGDVDSNGAVRPAGTTMSYTSREITTDSEKGTTAYNPQDLLDNIKYAEIQGDFNEKNKFQVRRDIFTLHSPDLEFDDYLTLNDFTGTSYEQVGNVQILKTLSDIDIQTETPTISSKGSGFVHKSFVADDMHGIVSGLFYDDYIVDDYKDGGIKKYDGEKSPCKWMVYLWHKNGSLNNDINRPSDKGTASAVLKKKIISNLRFGDSTNYLSEISNKGAFNTPPQLFSSDEVSIVKLKDKIYMGNIDTLINPDNTEGSYFAFGRESEHRVNQFNQPLADSNWLNIENVNTDFSAKINGKIFSLDDDTAKKQGAYEYRDGSWLRTESKNNAGDQYLELAVKKDAVRIKYKSTPHLVCYNENSNIDWGNKKSCVLPIVEITRTLDPNTVFGGQSTDALRENNWVPCGKPVAIKSGEDIIFEYSYGDTYYQRWDCLKTYPYTKDDKNQVVEIGSFMLETRINIDGRYDRNRGQINNLNMSPVNFNLLNTVYSQVDNFFTYKIMDEDSYSHTAYPNQITWSLTKTAGADVDLWTNMTMGSILELDGDKGKVNKLARLNDQMFVFQDTGIAQVLYNENVQISSTAGVPIEIANSGKVQGKRYISDTIGCSNKWAMTTTPTGIYFMDNNDKGIYLFNGQLQNLSVSGGLNSWAKQAMQNAGNEWTPEGFKDFTVYYDKQNQDILFINKDYALAYSERHTAFTSFYDYGRTPYFVNLDDLGLWIKPQDEECKLYLHNKGEYCDFFGETKPFWTTIVCNAEPQSDKTFTNIELRADVDGEGTYSADGKFTPLLPFDILEAWNEYQYGTTALSHRTGSPAMRHHTSDGYSSLKRKFRIWRADIPRAMYLPSSVGVGGDVQTINDINATGSEITDIGQGGNIKRSMDRIRNTWIYLRLSKQEGNNRTVLHDIAVDYFN